MNKQLFLKRILMSSLIFVMFFSTYSIIINQQAQDTTKLKTTSNIPNIASGAFSSDQYDNQWPMFRGELNHTGSLQMSYYMSDCNPIWNYTSSTIFSNTFSSPAVANDLIYLGGGDHDLYCLNVSTGSLKWIYSIPSTVESSPAVANGSVYVGGEDDNLYCINATTSAFEWKYTTSNSIVSSPAVANGLVYIGSNDDHLYCINAITGQQKWNYPTGSSIESSPAIADGYVFFGSNDGNLYCLNETTGSLYWSYTVSNNDPFGYSSPAIANGYVYIGNEGGSVYCLKIDISGNQTRLVWKYNTGNQIISSPAIANGFVYIGSNDNYLYCINAASGSLQWKYNALNNIETSPAVSDGFLYFGSSNDILYCLNATSGASLWNYTSSKAITSSPAIANGYVYDSCSIESSGSFDFGAVVLPMMFIPSAPRDLNATRGADQITLNWLPPADNYGTTITGYEIYRGNSTGNINMLVKIGNDLKYTDKDLKNGQIYYYEVKAITNSAGGYLSNIINATPSAVPTAPMNVDAVPQNHAVILTWQQPSYTGNTSITSYKIYRSTSPGNEVYLAITTNLSNLIYIDADLTNGQTYYYKISAVNGAGEGSLSIEVHVTPMAPSPQTSQNNSIGGSGVICILSASLIGIIAVVFSLKRRYINFP